ncbi:hypothetical protein L3Y34_017160 [Caenorhabditis briggsae]|uniref:F-box domain-containing protein n=3 Tax=Caenorhabditis briggsae TaxID=6238 RepID=A0AAE9DGQ9_CAEBR|nr:hypothetical protein L3Y34_017160 [Caenorhabditis briggsae]
MSSEFSLLNFPDIVMKMILGNLDFVSIQCLRKTSRDLRNFIDDVKPESKMTEFQLEFGDSCIKFLPKFDDKKYMLIRYQKAPNGGCFISTDQWKNQKYLPNSNFLNLAFNDFQTFLNFSNSGIFEEIEMDFDTSDSESENFSKDLFERISKSKSFPLKAKSFRIFYNSKSPILNILPLIDSGKLEELEFHGLKKGLDFSEISKMDQWKSAKTLQISNFVKNVPVESLIHFNLIKMDLFEVSLEMILSLKEAFLRSPHMMNYEISFRKSDAEEHLVELFGEDFELESFWYFGIPDDLENVISFGFGSNFIVFERILRNIVPIGARTL